MCFSFFRAANEVAQANSQAAYEESQANSQAQLSLLQSEMESRQALRLAEDDLAQSKAEIRQAREIRGQRQRVREKEQFDIARELESRRRLTGSQVAAYSANGIEITGSAANIIEDSIRQSELDIDTIRYNSKLELDDLSFQSNERLVRSGDLAKRSGDYLKQSVDIQDLGDTRSANIRRAGKLHSSNIRRTGKYRAVSAFVGNATKAISTFSGAF